MKEFKNKVAVVTGAASGIGRGIAERCVKEGMKVVLADVNEKDLAGAEGELRAMGGTVVGMRTDVAKRSDVEALARKTLEAFGAVHLLFNNAGVWGVIHGVKIFTPLMLAQNEECHIVNTSSTAGVAVGGGSAPYSVTKHGVVALSESLYLTLQQRNALVKVSVLCPGFVRTNILNSARNRPTELHDEPVELSPEEQAAWAFMSAAVKAGLPPSQVADQVFKAIKEERFYILTDLRWTEVIRQRVERLLRLENPQSPLDAVIKIVMENR
jgi:NAD(P)-dependent dehydrogenase (short-subunit alcohol dehydrogenase family)